MITKIGCMGHKKFRKQCDTCRYLPRNTKQEERNTWIIPNSTLDECMYYSDRGDILTEEDDNKKLSKV